MTGYRMMPAALCLALPAVALGQEEVGAWRAFVADHTEPAVSVVDLESGAVIDRFGLVSPAALHLGGDGRHVYAVQRDGDVVQVIDSGIEFDDHGDHGDIEVSDPRLLDAILAGDRPVHFVPHEGTLTVFFDGEGTARIVREAAFVAGETTVTEVSTAAPHHGVAFVAGGRTVISEPHPEDPDALPVGLTVLDETGVSLGETAPCPDLHGEATSGDLMAVACADGLLLLRPGDDGPAIAFMAYPETLPEGGKVTTLRGGAGIQFFLGNFGADAVVLIDPSDPEEAFRVVQLPLRRVDFGIDPADSRRIFVFTEDGRLHRIGLLSGEIEASAALTGPYSMDGHWSEPRPRLGFADGRVLVTDPSEARLLVVDPVSLAVGAEIPIEGVPFGLVAVGGHGESH